MPPSGGRAEMCWVTWAFSEALPATISMTWFTGMVFSVPRLSSSPKTSSGSPSETGVQ